MAKPIHKKKVKDWTLLTEVRDWRRWHKKEQASNPNSPASFPCYGKEVFDGQEETYYDYLFPEDIKQMHETIVGITTGTQTVFRRRPAAPPPAKAEGVSAPEVLL